MMEDAPICMSCKLDREKEEKPVRRLQPITLDKFRYKTADGGFRSRDTSIPMFLCEHCDEATIEARIVNLNRGT